MKSGFVALVGLPNAGKSTIVNALIGEKVGIISKKPQTTRRRVIGVYTDSESQICFIDAPGRVQASSGLNHFLSRELESVVRDCDACLAVLNLDAEKFEDLIEVVEFVKKSGRPWAIVINKTDLSADLGSGEREVKLETALLPYGVPVLSCSARSALARSANAPAGPTHDRSAPHFSKGEALRSRLLPIVKSLLPESSAPLFAGDIYTTQTSRELVAEIVREKCFEYLHQEVPYGLAVKVLKYDESHKIPRIFVEILVSKENFAPMVIGRGGSMIKRIGASARIECEKVLGQKIHLETHVKVKKDWVKNPEIMKELGYVITE